MALTRKNGVWYDRITDVQTAALPSPVTSGMTSWIDGVEITYTLASAYIQNWPAVQKAREDTAPMTWVSLKSAAPALNAVQADTGALAAGNYDFDVILASSDTAAVGKGLVIEHRNAANGATLNVLGSIPAGVAQQFYIRNFAIAANERIRVIAGTAAGAASSMYTSTIGRRVS